MQRPSWKKWKPLVFQTLLLAVVGGGGWFGIAKLHELIQARQDRLQALDILSDYRYRQAQQLPMLNEYNQFILSHASALDVTLTKEHLVDFVRTIEDLALRSNVEVTINSRDNTFLESKLTPTKPSSADKKSGDDDGGSAVKTVAPKKPTGILGEVPLDQYLRLDIVVTGTYPNIVNYLQQLETLPYALDVIGLNMVEHTGNGASASDALPVVVDPFNPGSTPPVPIPSPQVIRLDANLDTVVYLKSPL